MSGMPSGSSGTCLRPASDTTWLVPREYEATKPKRAPDIDLVGAPVGEDGEPGAEAAGAGSVVNTAAKAIRDQASARARGLAPILAELRAEGIVSAAAQARALNERSVPTPRGGKWTARSVINAAMALLA